LKSNNVGMMSISPYTFLVQTGDEALSKVAKRLKAIETTSFYLGQARLAFERYSKTVKRDIARKATMSLTQVHKLYLLSAGSVVRRLILCPLVQLLKVLTGKQFIKAMHAFFLKTFRPDEVGEERRFPTPVSRRFFYGQPKPVP